MFENAPSFLVTNSNYIEVLGYMCAEQMKIPLKNPFAKEHVIVMNTGMRSYLRQFIAQQNSICANVSFDQLWSFIWNIYRKITPDLGNVHYFEHDYIIWTLYQMLHEEHCADSVEVLASVKNYIADDADGTKTYELCVQIADTFDQYMMYRNDWILMWDAIAQAEGDKTSLIEVWKQAITTHHNEPAAEKANRSSILANVLRDNTWQPVLWIMLFKRLTLNSSQISPSRYDRSMVIEELCAKLNALDEKTAENAELPERVFLFGVSSLQPQVIRFLRALARHVNVNVMLLNPCREYWGDIDSQWNSIFSDFKQALNDLKQKLRNREVSGYLRENLNKRKISGLEIQNTDAVYKGKELSTDEGCYDKGELVEGNSLLLALGKQGKDNLSLMLDSDPGENRLYIKTNDKLRNAYESVPFNQQIKRLSENAPEAVEPSFDNLFIDSLKAGGDSILHHIQSQMLNLQQPSSSERIVIDPDDHSLEIHSCYTEQREIECLRDALLSRFKESIGEDGEPAVKPRDCLVMMPKIEKYAPYIEAVFGSVSPEDKNFIPYVMSDRSSRDSSQIADAVLKLLDIGVKRITLSLIIDLLTVPSIAQRYGFSADDVEIINIWCQEANIHWGLDETDATRDSGVENLPWTFEQGLFRMVQGYLLGDTAEELPVYSEIEGSDAQILGKFCLFVENLRHLRDEFVLPEENEEDHLDGGEVVKNLKEWSETLKKEIFERFFYDADDPKSLESDTYRECSEITQICEGVSEVVENLRNDNTQLNNTADLKIALPVFRSMLTDKLSKSNEVHSFKGSRVIFCSMIPMRAIPFKHIFILGMDDISYPRQDTIPAFNLVGVKGLFRRGDRSRSIDDRYCFMEAILSARESLYISYIGRSPIDNKDRNRSTVLEDLFDYICDVFTVRGLDDELSSMQSEDKQDREITEVLKRRLIRQDTLTSFNKDNYIFVKGDDRTLRHIPSFDRNCFVPEFYNAKGKSKQQREYLGNRGTDYFRVELEDKLTLSVDELKKWFTNPTEAFLKNNLEIRLPDDGSSLLTDDELFCLDRFHRNGLLRDLCSYTEEQPAADYLENLSSKGALPYGVLSDGLKKKLLTENNTLQRVLKNTEGERVVTEKSYRRTFVIELSEFAEKLNEPSLQERKFKVEFRGTVMFPNTLINYYSDDNYSANFIMQAVLNSFALHYAGAPSQVNTINREGKIIFFDVNLLGSDKDIDRLFCNLLKLAVIAMLRPLPVTSEMLTVVGSHQKEDSFFKYSPASKYLYGSYDRVSKELKSFIRAGCSDDEDCAFCGPLALYELLRSCTTDVKDKQDKTAGKKTAKNEG